MGVKKSSAVSSTVAVLQCQSSLLRAPVAGRIKVGWGFVKFSLSFFFADFVFVIMKPHGGDNFKVLLFLQLRFWQPFVFLEVDNDASHVSWFKTFWLKLL